MQTKPIAKTDYTYCTNSKCKQRELCARFEGNYIMKKHMLYSFCNFNPDNCGESEK